MREQLNDILELVDIEYYLDREGIDYRMTTGSSGTQLNVHECPVCGNSDWKVYLNADTGLGNCFAGSHPPDENFNKYSFIRAHSGLTGRETVDLVKQVAKEVGWVPRQRSTVQLPAQDLRLPQSFPIPIRGKNLKYLSERGIDIDTAMYFNLRYSHNGVFNVKTIGGSYDQSYERRIIIPIFDMRGELVSFQGRDITNTHSQKYLFPPSFSSTGKYLYNARNAIGAHTVVVGEGVFDVFALKLAMDSEQSLRGVVPIGTFGKHLAQGRMPGDQFGEFIKLQNAGLRRVVFAWDGTDDAILAAIDAGVVLKSLGLEVLLVMLPDEKDPNEISSHEMVKRFYQAQSLSMANMVKWKIRHG